MEKTCKAYWQAGVPCRPDQPPLQPGEPLGHAPTAMLRVADAAGSCSIAFGVDTPAAAHLTAGVPIPGYNAPALPPKTLRDPSLSLIALSGVEPSGPVMVEVPPVQHNSSSAPTQPLAGWRVGYADRYVQGGGFEPIEHRRSLLEALDVLRRAGVQLVPVPASRAAAGAQPFFETHNEIDLRATEYRLDALVSDSRSCAFHGAYWGGYPRYGAPLEEGATLWFYGARWAGEALAVLVKCYRQRARGATHWAE